MHLTLGLVDLLFDSVESDIQISLWNFDKRVCATLINFPSFYNARYKLWKSIILIENIFNTVEIELIKEMNAHTFLLNFNFLKTLVISFKNK